MGVYVKGMEMPKSCYDCDIGVCICNRYYDPNFDINEAQIKRHPDCPLVEVKAPHGRLADVSESASFDARYDHFDDEHMVVAQVMLDDLPTIIEADGKDDG